MSALWRRNEIPRATSRAITIVQAQLRPPGDGANGRGLLLLTLLQRQSRALRPRATQ